MPTPIMNIFVFLLYYAVVAVLVSAVVFLTSTGWCLKDRPSTYSYLVFME